MGGGVSVRVVCGGRSKTRASARKLMMVMVMMMMMTLMMMVTLMMMTPMMVLNASARAPPSPVS